MEEENTEKNNEVAVSNEEVISYILSHENKDTKKPNEGVTVTDVDDNTKEIKIDKSIAKEYIDVLKLHKGDLSDNKELLDEVKKDKEETERFKATVDPLFEADKFKHIQVTKLGIDPDKVHITDADKDEYMLSILNNTPFSLTINYSKLNATFTFRNKLVRNQEWLTRYIKEITLDNKNKSMTMDELCLIMFKGNLAITLLEILNKSPYSETKDIDLWDPELTYSTFKSTIESRIKDFTAMNQNLWSILVNAACVFERKEQLLIEFFINEDF